MAFPNQRLTKVLETFLREVTEIEPTWTCQDVGKYIQEQGPYRQILMEIEKEFHVDTNPTLDDYFGFVFHMLDMIMDKTLEPDLTITWFLTFYRHILDCLEIQDISNIDVKSVWEDLLGLNFVPRDCFPKMGPHPTSPVSKKRLYDVIYSLTHVFSAFNRTYSAAHLCWENGKTGGEKIIEAFQKLITKAIENLEFKVPHIDSSPSTGFFAKCQDFVNGTCGFYKLNVSLPIGSKLIYPDGQELLTSRQDMTIIAGTIVEIPEEIENRKIVLENGNKLYLTNGTIRLYPGSAIKSYGNGAEVEVDGIEMVLVPE